MEIRPIKTKKDYQLALARLELIFDAKKNSKEGDELEILSIAYEALMIAPREIHELVNILESGDNYE